MVDPGAGRLPAQGTAKTAQDVEAQNLSELKINEHTEDDAREEQDGQSAANADEVD